MAGQSMMDREGPPPRAHPLASSPGELLRAGACLAAAGAAAGTAVLASRPQSPEERRAALAFLQGGQRCLHLFRPIVASAADVRGAAAESLYEARFAMSIAARTPPLAAAPMPRPPGPAAGNPYALAECIAATRPDLVRALLAADPETAAERAAMAGLNPAFVSCAPQGRQIEVGRSDLRDLLAEALYRWSVVQRDGPASAWAATPASPAPALPARSGASH